MVDVQQAYIDLGWGVLVERDVLDVARRVNEYDTNLKVQFLNDANCGVDEPPYRIVEVCTDGVERPLFSVWTLDERVLQRIYAADLQKWDVLGRLDRSNAKAKTVENRRYKDRLEEASEITTTVLRSPKDTYIVPRSAIDADAPDSKEKVVFRAAPGEHGSTDRKPR
jgi:hypothetical protein